MCHSFDSFWFIIFDGDNAFGIREKTEDKPQTKSVPEVDEDRCVYCSMCANECPSDALTVEIDSWKIDEDECIGCAACVDVCPADALRMAEK